MTRELITALACALPDEGAPAEIVFIPEGSHKLTPKSHPKGINVHVPPAKGAAIAAALDADLKKGLARNVKPWFDFEHRRSFPASGYPTALRYEPGVGIMAAVEWSKSGREAVEGRDVRYFSPEFFIDANGVPNGLPDRGPLGGLVTEPAFRDIPAIAASDADPDPSPIMSTLIFAALSINAAATDAEASAVAAIEKLKVTAAEVPDLRTKLTAAEADLKKTRGAAGLELFTRAVSAGLAEATDEAAKAKYVTAAESGNDFAMELLREKVTAAETGPAGDPRRPIVIAGAADERPANLDQRITAAQAKARAELGSDADFNSVWVRAAELDPQAFN